LIIAEVKSSHSGARWALVRAVMPPQMRTAIDDDHVLALGG
jgi:hypothetical protein